MGYGLRRSDAVWRDPLHPVEIRSSHTQISLSVVAPSLPRKVKGHKGLEKSGDVVYPRNIAAPTHGVD